MKKMQLVIVFLLMTTVLAAQGKPKLELVIKMQKINMTAAEAAGTVKTTHTPGDTLAYFIHAKNIGTGIMVNPEIIDPVPAGVVYVVDSAIGKNCEIMFSIDGGLKYSDWPVLIQNKNSTVKQQAHPEMVTHLKWIIHDKIQAGKEKILSFKVVVK